MSIAKLRFKKGNYIKDISVDVIITESANASAQITSNPVEKGADYNDHVIIQPMTFSMTGVITDAATTAVDVATRITSADSYTAVTSPSKDSWQDLLSLHASAQPFDLVQNLKTYKNVIFVSISESQDKDTSRGLFFTATFQVLNLVGDSAVETQIYKDTSTADKSIPQKEGGNKQAL